MTKAEVPPTAGSRAEHDTPRVTETLLFAIGLAMQGTHRRATSPAVAARLTEHLDQLHDVIQDIRTAIFDLHAGPADSPRLRTTLHEAITELTVDTSLRTTVRMSGPVNVVPTRLDEHAVAVIREAISNAVRHAHVHELVVIISVDDNLDIDVTDNGVGIPDTVARSGLRNLQQRAVDAGGSCTLERSEGRRNPPAMDSAAPLKPLPLWVAQRSRRKHNGDQATGP